MHEPAFGLTKTDQKNLLRAVSIFTRAAILDAIAPLERRLLNLEAKGNRILWCISKKF
jgi:hypothetical protein